ncbi:DUF4174 domain-containing protein [Roseicyclus persicicus]|uniref:DUF4174 domain-containing protein n=1 Tax=Roseicyclus persicicus TaxID=2650661 RepID=A0A7X6GW90_9RHOB|nr:DUF4174 domain-containing protein [Roseibacterium persicicum]NKX43473.1 DUF4174 domain-containing protein [Roseibacterium persicicum]
MRPTPLALTAALLLAMPALAQTAADAVAVAAADAPETGIEAVDPMEPRNAADVTLEEFIWIARPVIVFADTPADPRFIEQMEMLAARPEPLIERDVVIIVDTDPAARTAIRQALRPRGFALVVMQKDGNVGFRRPSPRDVREITRGIDNFQFRQEELRSQGR